jgi:hypothetical protein
VTRLRLFALLPLFAPDLDLYNSCISQAARPLSVNNSCMKPSSWTWACFQLHEVKLLDFEHTAWSRTACLWASFQQSLTESSWATRLWAVSTVCSRWGVWLDAVIIHTLDTALSQAVRLHAVIGCWKHAEVQLFDFMQKVIVDLKLLKVKLRTYRLLKTCSSRTARLHAAICYTWNCSSRAARLHAVVQCWEHALVELLDFMPL